MVEDHPDVRLARKFVKEAFALFRKAAKWTRAQAGTGRPPRHAPGGPRAAGRRPPPGGPGRRTHPERGARSSAPRRPASTAKCSAAGASTWWSSTRRARRTEPGCWLPLLRCGRVVLAGDHCQLPPTVLSQEAARQGFGVSLLERLVGLYGDRGDAPARRAVPHARGDHGLLVGRVLRRRAAAPTPRCAAHRLCDLPGVRREAADGGAGAVHRHGRGGLRRGSRAGRREPAEPAGGGAWSPARCGRCWTPACGRRTSR